MEDTENGIHLKLYVRWRQKGLKRELIHLMKKHNLAGYVEKTVREGEVVTFSETIGFETNENEFLHEIKVHPAIWNKIQVIEQTSFDFKNNLDDKLFEMLSKIKKANVLLNRPKYSSSRSSDGEEWKQYCFLLKHSAKRLLLNSWC